MLLNNYEKETKVAEIILKRRGKELKTGTSAIFLIVVQTANGFSKPTKLIIILIITKFKNHRLKGLIIVEVCQSLQQVNNIYLHHSNNIDWGWWGSVSSDFQTINLVQITILKLHQSPKSIILLHYISLCLLFLHTLRVM